MKFSANNHHVFTNPDIGLEITVDYSDLAGGWLVRLHDVDGDYSIPSRRAPFKIEREALTYANRCLFPLENQS